MESIKKLFTGFESHRFRQIRKAPVNSRGFFYLCFYPSKYPTSKLGALILSLLKVENENKKLHTI